MILRKGEKSIESGRRKLLYIQVSRAIAILFVLLGHVNILFYTEFKYNWFHLGEWERTGGVDFFFTVTGFMIYYIYHGKAGNSGKATEFFLKRVIRIYPLYWLFTLLTIAASIIFPFIDEPYSFDLIIKSMLTLPTDPILASTWSLSYVMFFYIIFTAFIFKPKIFKPIIFLWIIISILLELKVIPKQGNSFFTSFSNLEILFGCLVAHLTLNYRFRYSSLLIILGMAGFLAVWINNIYHLIELQTPIFYSLSSMILMLGISEKDKKNRKVPKALSFLGDASYSIYIAHGPFLQFYILIFKKLNLMGSIGYFFSMSMVILLAVVSSCLVYILLEKPMSNYLRGVVFNGKKITSLKTAVKVAK
ncbi:acyltransferase family protein [Bacillus salipaludis]|uniref:Acyltransferase n=1 Tax=Bacillus salipaludis TaxID=2547811 RepID=A0AA90TWA7_9BACI|nr:acyltransferase [Bacillus salipaludis]MDQ6600118.1 acyltransferase [Bacillus salipaludis]